jgi:putative peptidoglycan lipid II flippase
LVPYFAHAALTLSIALGALVNALSLLVGLRRQGQFQPLPGWPRLVLQVLFAGGLLAVGLYAAAQHWDWTAMRSRPWERIGLMALVLAGSGVVYLTTLRVIGVDLRALLRRSGHD